MDATSEDLLRRASALRRAGRVADAIDAYKQLLAVDDELPNAWYNLGWLQKQARLFDDALSSYARALELGVDTPEQVHLNRSVIFSDHLGRPADAREELESALAKNPRYVPALLNLGNLHEDVGNRAGAIEVYIRALGEDPENALALARLAGLSHAPALDEKLADRLRRVLSRPDISAWQRADLGFALAGMLDAARQYREAFATATVANRASRIGSGARYHAAAHERFVSSLVRTFDRPQAASDPAAAPVFIVGMFRSGSTLLEQMLGAHSQVIAGGEFDSLPALIERIADYPQAVARADPDRVREWRNAYLESLPVSPSPSQLVTDKRPDNFLHIGMIKTIFPTAKILHTRRNPLDNLLSLYFLHLDPSMTYAQDIEQAAHWHREYLRLMAHWRSLYPADILDVDYDQLVRRPRPVLDSVLAFLDLEWEDGILGFHLSRSPVKTASVWQVRRPLHTQSSGRWRNYQPELEAVARKYGLLNDQ